MPPKQKITKEDLLISAFKILKEQGIDTLPENIEIKHAEQVVDTHEDPTAAVRKQKDSSMMVALKMLADGEGDAVISAGSTGALLTGATLIVKRVPGIRWAC